MSHPTMLYDRSPEELQALLLRHARSDAPSPLARRQAMSRAAVAAAAAASAGIGAATIATPKLLSGIITKAAASAIPTATIGKLLIVAFVSGTLALGGILGARRLLQPVGPSQGAPDTKPALVVAVTAEQGPAVREDTTPPAGGATAQVIIARRMATTPKPAELPVQSTGAAQDAPSPAGPTVQAETLSSATAPAVRQAMQRGAGTARNALSAQATTPSKPTNSQRPAVARRDAPTDGTDPAAQVTTAPSLARELGLLEQTREAIERGSPGEALSSLDQHRRDFPSARLAMESAALRVETLAGLHRYGEARAAASSFLKTYPDSPLADRVRVIAQRIARPQSSVE